MKSNKKLISAFLTVAIVALATIGFTGCNGTIDVNPVDNAEFIKSIRTFVWKEGANRYDDWTRNSPNITVAELTNGSPTARYAEFDVEVAANKFDSYEIFQVNVDIMADRDVTVTIGLYYGGGNEVDRRNSVMLDLKAGEVSHQEWNLEKNFLISNSDGNNMIYIRFDNMPTAGTEAFREWSQTQYTFSNLEFYALEVSHD